MKINEILNIVSVEPAGQAYSKWYYEDCVTNKNYKPKPLTRGEFIEKLKFDDDFYKKWGQPYITDLEVVEYFKKFKNKI